MAQKSIPISNKVGYSMFWNSMWDDKNNFSKMNQINFFIKYFLNFFFYDFFRNYYLYIYNFKKYFYKNIKFKYELNIIDDKKINNLFFKNFFKNDLYISKIWLFKYQNWIIIYFIIYSKINFDNFKKNIVKNYDNFNILSLINNYYLNLFKINLNNNYLNNYIIYKNNF